MQHMDMYRIAMQTDGALAIQELVLHVSYPEWVNSTTHPLGEILVCSILSLDTMDGGMYTIALHSTIRILILLPYRGILRSHAAHGEMEESIQLMWMDLQSRTPLCMSPDRSGP